MFKTVSSLPIKDDLVDYKDIFNDIHKQIQPNKIAK